VAHIDDLPFFGNTQVALGILFSCVIHQPSYFIYTIPPFSSFPSLLVNFDRKVMQICGDIMGPGSWEFIRGPLTRCQARFPISFDGICFFCLWRIVPHLHF
jgi:hypothetical protein